MPKVVGIDLGTTNSVVGVMEGKEVKVIPNAQGSNLNPSIVAFTDKGERLVGILAKRQAVTNPKNTVYEIKRLMGRRAKEVELERKRVSYEVIGEGDEPVRVRAGGKTWTPQEISAMILQDMKQSAEIYLGTKITDAVITCPAYFNDAQRQATKEAGIIAGFNVRRIFNEPTASSLAYGLDKKVAHKIAVYDLGGGTYDISILEVDKEVIQVLSVNGDTHLGGSDFDERVINYVADEFKKNTGIDLRKDPMALQRLKEACERARCELSQMLEVDINLPFITADQSGPKHLTMKLTRAKLEHLISDLVEKTRSPLEQALADARLKPSDMQEVVLVGGATRTPCVQRLVQEFFMREPHKGVNPDEVVGVGAAVQAAILGGEMRDILLLDVTPLTLGVETLGGIRTPLIKRNTTIPVRKSEIFSTAQDGQTQVEIHIVQGEREMAADCRSLGRFILEGIPPTPRGIPKIEVIFEIDANGILNVTAQDLATKKQQSITIKASTGLAEQEIEKMVKDAEQYSEQDKKRRELVEVKNQADNQIYHIEKMLREHQDKVSNQEKEKIQSAIDALKKAMEGDSAQEIKGKAEELNRASFEFSKRLYEKAAKTEQPPPAEGKPDEKGKKDGGERIVDADFETK